MAHECMTYLMGKLEESNALLERLNKKMLNEWRAYSRYFSISELTRLRRRLLDDDDIPTACYALC